MTEQELRDRYKEIVSNLRSAGCRVTNGSVSTCSFTRQAVIHIELTMLEDKKQVPCKMCMGTGGYHTHEGTDMELVWHPCRYCLGRGLVEEL